MSLANIARTSDGALNRAIGRALVEGGYASTADIEKDLGTELSYQSDLYVVRESGPVRLEIMWRSTTGRAEIANYVLMKLGNYGKAIGLLG
jgi:DNA (cytosine-5)-methyltransferase 1